MMLTERKCKNPDHDEVQSYQPDPKPSVFVVKRQRGRPQEFCESDGACSQWFRHNYRRNDYGQFVRVRREYVAGSYEDALREGRSWIAAGAGRAVSRIPIEELNPIASLSLDAGWETDAKPIDVGANDPERDEIVSSIKFPFPGRDGMLLQFSYYRAFQPGMGAGDGVNVRVLRKSDGAVMSVAHPDAQAISAELATEQWQERYHSFLEQLRAEAAAWDATILGPAPVIAAQNADRLN